MSKIIVTIIFVLNCIMPPQGYAQILSAMGQMPAPGVAVSLTGAYVPAQLKGMIIDPNTPFQFDFIVRRGDDLLPDNEKQAEYFKLIKYFLAALAVPDADQWVNLSPYEKDRIIPESFGLTEMGRDLLAQDYFLKQISASLTGPDTELGKKFWAGVYARAYEKFGTTDIPTDVFSKVWIVPDKAVVYEKGNTAYILEHHLKVMTEMDYLAARNNGAQPQDDAARISLEVMREVIIPALEKEVNEGKNFAVVRQIYSGVLLAVWYKIALKNAVLNKVYSDRGHVKGIDQDPATNERIWEQYVDAFRKGAINMIREDVDAYSQEVLPRKYFSGGAMAGMADARILERRTDESAAQTADADFAAGPSDVVQAKLIDPNGSGAPIGGEVGLRSRGVELRGNMQERVAFAGDVWMRAGKDLEQSKSSYRVWVSGGDVLYQRHDQNGPRGSQHRAALGHQVSVGYGEDNEYSLGDRNLDERHFAFSVDRGADGQYALSVENRSASGATSFRWNDALGEFMSSTETDGINDKKARLVAAMVLAGAGDILQAMKILEGRAPHGLNVAVVQKYLADRVSYEAAKSGGNFKENAFYKARMSLYRHPEMTPALRERYFQAPLSVMNQMAASEVTAAFEAIKQLPPMQEAKEAVVEEEDQEWTTREYGEEFKDTVWKDILDNEADTLPPPEEPDTQDAGIERTINNDMIRLMPAEKAKNEVRRRIEERNGKAGFQPAVVNERITLTGEADDVDAYKNLLKLVEIGLNMLFYDQHRDALLQEVQSLVPVASAEGYHDFTSIPAREALLGPGQGLPQGLSSSIQRYFLGLRGRKLGEYVDGDLMRDVIRNLGGKMGERSSLLRVLRDYFEKVYHFETARDSQEVQAALNDLLYTYSSYKFSKAVDLGRAKLLQGGRFVLDEEKPLVLLDPKKVNFQVVSSSVAATLADFKAFVRGQAGRGSAGDNFYIFHRSWQWDGRKWMLAARNGRMELYYTSTTYSKVAGQSQWCRQEAALGVIREGNLRLGWFAKPAVESGHDVNDASSKEINRRLRQAGVVFEDVGAEKGAAVIGLHLDLGLVYAPDGKAMSRERDGKPQYDPNGLSIDPSRYPAWSSVAFRYVQRDAPQMLDGVIALSEASKVRAPSGELELLDQQVKFDRVNSGLDRAMTPDADASEASVVELNEAASASVNGGIDLTRSSLDLQIKRDGNGIILPLDQQKLDNIRIDGLVPVILNIYPATVAIFK